MLLIRIINKYVFFGNNNQYSNNNNINNNNINLFNCISIKIVFELI